MENTKQATKKKRTGECPIDMEIIRAFLKDGQLRHFGSRMEPKLTLAEMHAVTHLAWSAFCGAGRMAEELGAPTSVENMKRLAMKAWQRMYTLERAAQATDIRKPLGQATAWEALGFGFRPCDGRMHVETWEAFEEVYGIDLRRAALR